MTDVLLVEETDGMYTRIGLCLVIIAASIKRSIQLDHMKNVIDLTAKDFEDRLANKHKFVLFYEPG